MTTRSKGPGAGFQWLSRGIGVGFRHPRPLIGGAIVVTLLMLVPAAITFAMQWQSFLGHAPPDPEAMFKTLPVSTVLNLLLVPVFAGYLQLIHAADHGEAARARDIFKPYRSGEALRLIGFGLVMLVIYAALFALLLGTIGHGLTGWYIRLLQAQAAHHALTSGLPGNFGSTLALFLVVGLYLFAAYAIALGQVALGQRSVFGAIGDGLVGALKNVLPLIVLVVCGIFALFVVILAFVVVALVVGLIGVLVGKWLTLVLIVAAEVAMAFLFYMIQFGTQYYLWRDVCGDDVVADPSPVVAA